MAGLSLWVGISSTVLSLFLALGTISSAWNKASWNRITHWLSPLLAIPHIALAFGLAFLIMPSGILTRVIALLAGWGAPPDWNTVKDPMGISLIMLLVIKETPFLIFVLINALQELPINRLLGIGQSLGYTPWSCWVKLIWPRLYPMIRLPVFIVLSYSLSVVDIPLILGPDTPPLFSVQVLYWLQDPDLSQQLPAAAGSITLFLLVSLAIGIFWVVEKLVSCFGKSWLTFGHRGYAFNVLPFLFLNTWRGLLVLFSGALIALLIWSFVWRWRFPSLWPTQITLRNWQNAWPQLAEPVINTLVIGLISASLGVLLSIFMLESGNKFCSRIKPYLEKTLFIPMLLPQLSFLFGIQILMLKGNLDGYLWSVILIHLLFVFPYCYLSLAGPWNHYDERHTTLALLLTHSRLKAFWNIKLPMLWKPIMASLSLGFAVSVAQYLPTLFAGAGRITTITTEAVSLAGGNNRRLTSVYGLVQMLLPMIVYMLAMLSARWSLLKLRKRLV